MPPLTDEQLDTPLAELEIYGLSCRSCNKLEDEFGAIYVRDLIGAQPEDLLALEYFGHTMIRELRLALRNLRDDCIVKTVNECLESKESASET